MDEKDQKTTEVRDTKEQRGNTNIRRQSVTTATKIDATAVIQRIIYYLAGVIIALLALRIVLLLLAANQGSAFVDFVYVVSGLFAMPFYGMFNYQPTYGESVFEISSVVAIIVYGLAAIGIAKLFTLTRSSDEAA